MQIRSFRGSREPVWVNALLLSARDCLGPDPRRALGPAATPAASTGRTRDRTRPVLQAVRKFLPGRRPHVTQSRDRRAQGRALFGRSSRRSNEDIRRWTFAFWADQKSFLQESR